MSARRTATLFGANLAAVIGVAAVIQLTGGLPSQLVHLYYIPVVAGAMLLPGRFGLAIAAVAAVATGLTARAFSARRVPIGRRG